ncbi:peptidoglycan recognition family protein [Amycolatopsis cynarae]|uniref:Peptidoglycan recognition family protein n=1 Tax=Amycolatopsis cynarae TaxID=2995223 RepID=A0ABY7B7D3_9PSEU|nr:peptidoglycan recognition family protein [Amycolatopsis sp. HUAS 11-8]WAL67329.1 peptidoglycan recognition family protein [Amycolatopsis sp. HUAS 11-8]
MADLSRRIFLGTTLAATGGLLLPATAWAMAEPRIYSCDEWGARPPQDTLVTLDHKPVRILIHHIACPNSTDYSLAHAFQVARDDQHDHMDNNGWADTGQHFTVSRGGYRLEGRHGSLAALRSGTRMIRGAHCPGQNESAIGIENEGTYITELPTQAQWKALVALCAYTCSQYGIPVAEIKGHRDYYNTECPGEAFYGKLAKLRSDVAAALG